MIQRYLLAGFLGLCATGASAASSPNHFLEAGVGEVDEGNALFIGGSMGVSPNVFVLGRAYAVDSGIDIPGYDGKGFYLEGGLGYVLPVAPKLDAFANAQILYANLDVPGDDNDVGYITRVGARYEAMSNIDLEGAVAYSSNDLLLDDGVGFSADARYRFTPALSAGIGWAQDTELDGAFLNVRYRFQ